MHLDHPNIVCLGDAAGIPTSKTSAAIRKQAPIAVDNLCSLIAGKAPETIYDGYAACPIITDYGHVLMAEFDYEKKCCQSFPFSLIDTTKELRSAWWLKLYVLKPMYFHLMLRGLACGSLRLARGGCAFGALPSRHARRCARSAGIRSHGRSLRSASWRLMRNECRVPAPSVPCNTSSPHQLRSF